MKRLWPTAALATMALVFGSPVAAFAKDADCDRQEIMADLVETARGQALLCRSSRGIRGTIAAQGLVPGDAYTVWWVYFDDPKQCAEPGACGLSADFGGENPVAVFGRMDSTIASENEGTYFIGRIGGFTPSEGSQIWMWIFGHGEANFDDGRRLARQLLTPELPGAGAPHLGNTIDGRQGFSAAIIKFDIPGDDELDDE